MGGEWYFLYKDRSGQQTTSASGNKEPLDVSKYQELLLRLKTRYEMQFDAKHALWCDINALPPPDNVFVRFKFSCDRHTNWGEDHPWFNLYWIPFRDQEDGSLHDRCSTDGFNNSALFDVQREIVETFPDHFTLYREWTDLKVYDSEKAIKMVSFYTDYNYNYRSDSDDNMDFTACDKDDCGYCGHCPY